MRWIIRSSLLENPAGRPDRKEILDETIARFTWPSHIGRLASNVIAQITSGKAAAAVKAEEWDRVRTTLPVALWLTLRDPATDEIAKKKGHPRVEVHRAVVDITAAPQTLLARQYPCTTPRRRRICVVP